MGYGLEGKKVRLVPMDPDRHFENAVRWINDLANTTWISIPEFPTTKAKEREWFDARCLAGQSEANWAIETMSGEHIGFSGLFHIDFVNRTADSGSLIGEANFRGKGYGSDAAKVRAWFAFECLGLQTLFSSYFEENEGSAQMQAAVGYEIWGRKPNAIWKRGEFRTMVHTFLTRDKWLSLNPETPNAAGG
jgi:RimJ/RimL family protein N-acetyltransferase